MATGKPPPSDQWDDIPFGEDDDDAAEAWDAHDPRRQRDPMAPPTEPCECACLHCGRTFMSSEMWLQRVIGDPRGFEGYWMCPTPNCSGAGFTFDIFPTDPQHPANEGWHSFEEEEDEEFDDDFEDDDTDVVDEVEAEAMAEQWATEARREAETVEEYDPAEPQYPAFDTSNDDDDLEGEEWKYGLAPGERPESPWAADALRAREEAEARYDAPDERPREIQWEAREERPPGEEEDIPF